VRRDIMAKKDKKNLYQIYKVGEKYHCADCNTEIKYGNNCPTCNKKLEWDQAKILVRHF
jgi:rubrerythrin